MKAKQHPCVSFPQLWNPQDFIIHLQPVLLGPMGIGKSSCQDVCMWQLCGSREVSKIDSGHFFASEKFCSRFLTLLFLKMGAISHTFRYAQHHCETTRCTEDFPNNNRGKFTYFTINFLVKVHHCEMCGNKFAVVGWLNGHLWEWHAFHQCEICGNKFAVVGWPFLLQ